jgi:hypothetical protein
VLKGFLLSAKSPIKWEREGINSEDEFANTEFQYGGIKLKGKMLAYNVFVKLENRSNNTFYSYGDYLQNPNMKKALWKTNSRDFYSKLFEIAGLELKKGKPLSKDDITPENLRHVLLSVMNAEEWGLWGGSISDFQRMQFELDGYEPLTGFSLLNAYAKSRENTSIKDMFEEAQIEYNPKKQRKNYSKNQFQERTSHLFGNPNNIRKSLLELMTQEEWNKPKEFQDVRLRRIKLDGREISLHTLMYIYSMHKYNTQQEEIDEKICFSDQEKVSAPSSREVLDEILNIAGIKNRWIPALEDVDLRDPNFIRRVLLNAEYDGKPISSNEIKNMGTEWRKVRVKEPEIGFDKALRSLVQYFTAYDDWQEHPEHSLNYVVQKMKRGKANKTALLEVLNFAGL